MLDPRFIRAHPDQVREAIRNKGEAVDLDAYLAYDQQHRRLLQQAEALKQKRNVVSHEIARLKRAHQDSAIKIAEIRQVADRIKALDDEIGQIEKKMQAIAIRIPNLPHVSVPIGHDESNNVVVRQWGEIQQPDFPLKPHWALGEALGILDFAAPAKLAGPGFVVFKGLGARLERALIQFMLDLHVKKQGYTEVSIPFMGTRSNLFGTGQLPKLEEDMYRIEKDDLFLIPTAEVPMTNLHRQEILDEAQVPLYYTAYSPCFRREAGTYGRETRGLIRVHQFDKVEMVKFVKPETSYDELETLVHDAEEVLQLLALPYRVVALCSGDLSFAAAKCYDIEVWAPALQRWLEVSSCSNFEDFQARRAGIRYRPARGRARFIHTLNGSGLALPRTMLALLETYQTDEGSILVPQVLHDYMGERVIKNEELRMKS